jgi:hypothetical protein
MIHLRVAMADEKHLRITGMDPLLADCLLRLEEILEQRDAPSPQRRLYPVPSTDRRVNEEWDQFVHPELRHLFVSAGETVAHDLTGITEDATQPGTFQLTFPAVHLPAWMSAINQARLILGAQFAVTEADMEARDFDPENLKHYALVKIHILGHLLHLLVEQESEQ